MIHQKTLEDLEFSTVLTHLSEICQTELGKKYALKIKPFKDREALLQE